MLFASGNNGRVTVSGYPAPAGSSKPVDTYLVADVDGDCKVAAKRASISVWQYLSAQGRQPEAQVLGFDISELAVGSPVVGPSGGLAFVLAAYCHFTGENIGAAAATGILQSAGAQARVSGVKGIGKKLEGALSILPAGGQLFYPADNDAEIGEQLKQRCRACDIALMPVADISELFAYLETEKNKVPETLSEKKNPASLIAGALLVFFCLLIAAGYIYFSGSEIRSLVPPKPAPVSQPEQKEKPLVTEEQPGGIEIGGNEEVFKANENNEKSDIQEDSAISGAAHGDTVSHEVNRDIVPQELFLPDPSIPENELTEGFE